MSAADSLVGSLQVIIAIEPRQAPDGSTRNPRGPPPKSVLRKVWAQIEGDEAQGRTNFFGGVRPAFDGRTAAYANRRLPSDPVNVRSFRLLVKQRVDSRLTR